MAGGDDAHPRSIKVTRYFVNRGYEGGLQRISNCSCAGKALINKRSVDLQIR